MSASNQQPNIRILDGSLTRHVDAFRLTLIDRTPKTIFPELVEIFGSEAAVKFMDIFHGLTIKVPSRELLDFCVRDADIYARLSSAYSSSAVHALAEKYKVTESQILHTYHYMVKLHKRYGYDR